MALQWTSDLAVGVTQIDEQHKRMFFEIDKLVSAVNRKEFALVPEALNFLATYAVEHFSAEEELMTECNYPGMQKHVGQHRSFVKDFVELRTTYESDGATVTVVLKLNNWLFSWLWNHIRGSDVEMGRYAQAHAPSLKSLAHAAR